MSSRARYLNDFCTHTFAVPASIMIDWVSCCSPERLTCLFAPVPVMGKRSAARRPLCRGSPMASVPRRCAIPADAEPFTQQPLPGTQRKCAWQHQLAPASSNSKCNFVNNWLGGEM
jgi:hypothetical protein